MLGRGFTGKRDSRRDDQRVRSQRTTKRRGFLRRCDDAVASGVLSQSGQAQDLLLGRGLDSDVGEVGGGHAGDDGQGQDAQAGEVAGCGDSGGHDAGAAHAVDSHHGGAQSPGGADRAGDRVRDLEELEVQEHVRALGHEAFCEVGAGGGEQFQPNLVEAALLTQAVDHLVGSPAVVEVQGDDDLTGQVHSVILTQPVTTWPTALARQRTGVVAIPIPGPGDSRRLSPRGTRVKIRAGDRS